ncbi:MAG TPA: hypothetical protein VK679_05430, partial [Gemmatimonadaceae bacterium]|nr:hypothetical protein [Gemmatimonadaceae bacterium]
MRYRITGIGPRLGAKNADFERALRRIDTEPHELVENREHVARRHHDDVGLEIGNELHLPLRHAARDGHHRAAEPLGPIVCTEPASKEPVAIRDMHDHPRSATGGSNRPRHELGPRIDVAPRVSDDGRLSSRAGRRVNAHDLIPRDGEHAKGIIGTQIVLGRKRKPSQILYLPEISGMHASGVEGTAIMRHIGVGVVERRGQS